MIDPALPLELLNGAGMVLEFCFIGLMLMYLWRETRRRGLAFADWIGGKLPPSMNLAIAVVVCDCGVWVRTIVIWAWREFYGGGDFGNWQAAALVLGALLIVVGSLCKIRAVSKPDYGDGPWMLAAAATLAFVLASVLPHIAK